MSVPAGRALTDVIERTSALDTPAKTIAKKARQLLAPPRLKDAVSGTPLGHPVHPPLTDLVIGFFTSATVLDLVAPRAGDRAARRLLVLGIAAALPTAVAGLSDWADSELADEKVRRVGLIHAGANDVALLFYGASLAARRRGKRTKGVLLGLAGALALHGGGYLGGHLSLIRGVGVNQTAFDPGPAEWTPVASADDVTEGTLQAAQAADTPVLLTRYGGTIYAIHDRCSHRGCPLSNGKVDDGAVTCTCHGSRFDIRDGAVLQGPAVTGQPTFETREDATGKIEVRRRSTG